MSEAAASLVVDPSVVVTWYVPEDASGAALALLASDAVLLAPDILVAEVGNALWKKAGRGEFTDTEARQIAQMFLRTAPVVLWPSRALLDVALEIALAHGRSVYDALYLALALAEGCPVITADARLVQALRGTALEPAVALLS